MPTIDHVPIHPTDFVPGEWVPVYGPGPLHYAEQFVEAPPNDTREHYDMLRITTEAGGGYVVEARLRESTAAAAAGLDTDVCEFCSGPIGGGDDRGWRRGLDGCAAHDECIANHLF